MHQLDTNHKDTLETIAKYHLGQLVGHLQQQATDHGESIESIDVPRASAAIGVATFAWIVVGVEVKLRLLFEDGQVVVGSGRLYGAGLVPGPCEGVYAGVPPDQLLGTCGCVSGGMGALEALWFARHKKPLGVFVASRPGTVFDGGGELDFKKG